MRSDMDEFSLYKFKRENNYTYYVRFFDEMGNRITKSTGIVYDPKATKKVRAFG